MSKNIIAIVLVLFLGTSSFAQKSINDYKYVVVPLQFDFLQGKDKYRTSTLTRYLFKNEGFEVYFDEEELPEELFNDRCLALYANVLKVQNFFKNKVQIELKDCYGNVLLLSQEGSSKVKEYDKAYPIVIREAFESVKFLNYKYNPNSTVGSKKQSVTKAENIEKNTQEAEKAQAEVKRLKQEVEELKKQKEIASAEAELKAKNEAEAKKLKAKNETKEKLEKKTQIVEATTNVDSNLLYAQPVDKGFQLVDASPKVVMVLIKTAVPNVFTVKGKDAIVFKEGDTWFYSENDTKKALNIKF